MTDEQIDELVLEVTAGEAPDREAARASARRRLLARARPAGRAARLGWRGIAAIAAVLIVPTGAAVAAQLGSGGGSEVMDGNGNPIGMTAEDCPELVQAAAVRGLSTENLTLADCPAPDAETDQVLDILARMAEQRAVLRDA